MAGKSHSAVPILVADDHEVVRAGLRAWLESQCRWHLAAEAADGLEAVEKARELNPAVVLMDVIMPRLNGIEATRQILTVRPATRVIIFTMHGAEQTIRRAFEAGAVGYFLKGSALENLSEALENVLDRRKYICSGTMHLVLNDFLTATSHAGERLQPLSAREREVVQLISEGKTTKEIASRLRVSLKTGETHRYNLMRKIGAHSVADVVRYAIRNGIIAP